LIKKINIFLDFDAEDNEIEADVVIE